MSQLWKALLAKSRDFLQLLLLELYLNVRSQDARNHTRILVQRQSRKARCHASVEQDCCAWGLDTSVSRNNLEIHCTNTYMHGHRLPSDASMRIQEYTYYFSSAYRLISTYLFDVSRYLYCTYNYIHMYLYYVWYIIYLLLQDSAKSGLLVAQMLRWLIRWSLGYLTILLISTDSTEIPRFNWLKTVKFAAAPAPCHKNSIL